MIFRHPSLIAEDGFLLTSPLDLKQGDKEK